MKVQINLNDDLVKKIDKIADDIGVSRSSLCAVWIGSAINGYDVSSGLKDQSKDWIKKSLDM